MKCRFALVNVLILLSLAFVAHSQDEYDESKCVYTIYVRTGWAQNAGTDAVISLELWNSRRERLVINDIEEWGSLMGRRYNHFEPGNLDAFSGVGRCLGSGPICGLRIMSDGSGRAPDWYCESVEVFATGPDMRCTKQKFDVQQWLTGYRRFEKNQCSYFEPGAQTQEAESSSSS